jgi:hypothetical protein
MLVEGTWSESAILFEKSWLKPGVGVSGDSRVACTGLRVDIDTLMVGCK